MIMNGSHILIVEITGSGEVIHCKSVILTTGTFLRGIINIGMPQVLEYPLYHVP